MRFTINSEGFILGRNNKLYKWDEIIKIEGYLIYLTDTDSAIIEIKFNDGFILKFDECIDGYYNLMNNILPQILINYNKNWYIDINTSIKEKSRITIYENPC